jgi:hypothetical protein
MFAAQRIASIEEWFRGAERRPLATSRADVALVALFAVLGGACACYVGSRLEPLTYVSFNDFWFGADTARVFGNLTDRFSNHYRTNVHPLFSLLVCAPVTALSRLAPISRFSAVLIALTVNSAITTALLCCLLRSFLPRLDTAIWSLAFLSSAAFLFWFGTPETFAFGSFSIALALLIAAVPLGRRRGASTIASALTLAFTITNWTAGLIATLVSQPVRRAAQVTIYAFAAVAALSVIQYTLYPSAGKFLFVRGENHYLMHDPVQRSIANTTNFWINSMLAPRVAATPEINPQGQLSVRSRSSSLSPLAKATAVGWLILLAGGVYALAREARLRPFGLALGAMLACQLALHLVYGDEPFLYAAHYMPLLIVLGAFSAMTRLRWPALALAVLVVGAAAFNNLQQFDAAATLLHRLQREQCTPSSPCSRGMPVDIAPARSSPE